MHDQLTKQLVLDTIYTHHLALNTEACWFEPVQFLIYFSLCS